MRAIEPIHIRNAEPSDYLLYDRKFATFFGRSPTELGEAKICQYLLPLQAALRNHNSFGVAESPYDRWCPVAGATGESSTSRTFCARAADENGF